MTIDDFFNGVISDLNSKQTLADKILEVMLKDPHRAYTDWELADLIYDRCMQKKSPGNGARITNIRKALHTSQHFMRLDSGSFKLA